MINDTIPSQFLVKCEWPEMYQSEELGEFISVTLENLEEHKRCTKIHNALVEILEGR